MTLVNLHVKHVQVKYKNTLISKATFIVFILRLLTIVIPFVIAFKSRGFLTIQDTFYEQPDIKYFGEYLFIGITNNLSKPIICKNIRNLHTETFEDTSSQITVREIDNNFDIKVDKLHFSLKIELPKDESLKFFTLVLPIEYNLHTDCPTKMDSAILYQSQAVEYAFETIIEANLDLSLNTPITCRPHSLYRRSNSIFENSNNFKLEQFMSELIENNMLTPLSNIFTTYKLGIQHEHEIHLRVRYPIHKILYEPRFWQVAKWAWVQYLSVYIVFAWCVNKFKDYIFDNRLLLFYQTSK